MRLKLRRATDGDRDRAVIARQSQLLVEKDERILALEAELEAARALGDSELIIDSHRYLTGVYRAQARFLREQLQLAFDILEGRQRRRAA
jgi:hypothetical protein